MLPDSVAINGTIVKLTFGYCGIICSGGVAKIRIFEKISNYTDKYIYLVTTCFQNTIRKNDQIQVKATKLKIENKECYYQNIRNPFKSTNTPFYKLSEKDIIKIVHRP